MNPDNKNNEGYRQLLSLLKEAKSSYESVKQSTYDSLKNRYDMIPGILEAVLALDVENMDYEKTLEVFLEYSGEKGKERLKENASNMEEKEFEEFLKNRLIEIKLFSDMILTAEKNMKEIEENSEEVAKEFLTYHSSSKYNKLYEDQIKQLNELMEVLDENDEEYKKAKKKVEILLHAKNYTCILRRLGNEKYKDQEKAAILKGFFSMKFGKYDMDKFNRKIKNFGFSQDLYKHFYNLEEVFVPEYEVYNNLFLYVFMRFVGNANPYDKEDCMYVRSMIEGLCSLIYHKIEELKYEKDKEKNEKPGELKESAIKMIEIIKTVDEIFTDHEEEFLEGNTTRPGHPVRKEMEESHERMRRQSLVKSMKEKGITGWNDEMSIDELQEFYNTEIDKMIDAQNTSLKEMGELTDVTNEEDGSVTITPKVKDIKEVMEEESKNKTEENVASDEVEE